MSALEEVDGSSWVGACELWLDPFGNDVVRSDCSLSIDGSKLAYQWSHEGKSQQGSITLDEQGAQFTDTFHATEPMHCRALTDARGLFQVLGVYGPDSDWGWRIGASIRSPTGELVVQMTNIAPWGEEVRAVRMTLKRQ
jgi:hypothetical protein